MNDPCTNGNIRTVRDKGCTVPATLKLLVASFKADSEYTKHVLT